VIVKAGDPGRAFYVITNGKAKVVAGTTPGGKKEAELGRGEFFGSSRCWTATPGVAPSSPRLRSRP
jgi:hypothetical protein